MNVIKKEGFLEIPRKEWRRKIKLIGYKIIASMNSIKKKGGILGDTQKRMEEKKVKCARKIRDCLGNL